MNIFCSHCELHFKKRKTSSKATGGYLIFYYDISLYDNRPQDISIFFMLLLLKCNEEKTPYIYYECKISLNGFCYISIRKLKLKINSVILKGANQVLFYNYSLNIVFSVFLLLLKLKEMRYVILTAPNNSI